jgi:hypothetical protein
MKMSVKTGILALLLFTGFQTALAEKPGYIKGKVTDTRGDELARHKVLMKNAGQEFAAVTDEKGEFVLELPPGIYKVSTEKIPGFVPLQLHKIEIQADRTRVLRIMLRGEGQDGNCKVEVPSPAPQKLGKPEKKP